MTHQFVLSIPLGGYIKGPKRGEMLVGIWWKVLIAEIGGIVS